jgi:transforming growth factor-beta-induced protein
MKKILSLLVALVLVFTYTPVTAAEGDIVDVAAGNEIFSTLVAALTEAELVEALQADGPFTVFAPTDDAFADLLAALEISAADLLAHPDLSKVLLYHVVSGKIMSTDLTDGAMPETLNGETLTVDLSDGVKINSSTVTTADVEATNGVIHIIDTVLVPSNFTLEVEEEPDIVGIALGDEQFSMLVSLLQQADLVSALQAEGPFTVFAPTNDAFNDLLEALDISADQLMAQPDLANVLLYHVVSGKVLSTDLSDGLMAETLYGESITFDLSDGVKANSSNVIAADVMASNGVVHVIDSVLVPSDFVLADVDMTSDDVPKTGDVSALPFLAVGLTGLAGVAFSKKRSMK